MCKDKILCENKNVNNRLEFEVVSLIKGWL